MQGNTHTQENQRTKISKQITNLMVGNYLMEGERECNTGISGVNCLRKPCSTFWAQISLQQVVHRLKKENEMISKKKKKNCAKF